MSKNANVFPEELRKFVREINWTYAKTIPEWPHEYIVRDRVNENLFLQLVSYIRSYGYEGKFYNETYIYYDEGSMSYWTIGEPIEETTIVNRCKEENLYKNRLQSGTLPEPDKKNL